MYNVKDGMPIILARIKARNFEMDEEEMFRLRDRLLPSIIGLLRSKELPSELRNYHNTLTLSMKSALRTKTKELRSLLVDQPMEPLAGFPSHELEEFIQNTYGAFKVLQVQLVWASEVKKAVEWIVLNLDSCDAAYATDSISVANAKACQELSPYSLQEIASKSPTTSRKANDISSFDVSSNLR
ncbi:hypothetical protein C5167_047401 [Papaver somniferum]|uniref:Uncharacterized protein n=1 Tax=Papaver somniferum TaxID=3469 RepID=A0A4Y7LKG0_PAPSO|nr:hypothetical protein C5167_047401 [Papaver somniferum]